MKGSWMATGLAAALLASASVHAATVTFDSPVNATNTSALDIQFNTPMAVFVEAGNVGDGSPKTFVTAGGSNITFTAMPSSLGNVDMPAAPSSTSGFYNGGSQWNAGIFTNATDSVEWGDILRGNAWHNQGDDTRPLTLRLANLTVGQPYSVSLFAVDQRAGDSATRTQRYAGGFSGGTFSNGISDSFSTTNAIMVIGTFVANATYQDIFIQETDGIGFEDTTLAAYALFAVGTPTDSDGDGLPDSWETEYFGNLGQTGAGDPDIDGYTNMEEFLAGSNPTNTLSTPLDTDADGLPDEWEIEHFGNLNQTGEGDFDGDYATNEEEQAAGTDPTDRLSGPDTDSDGLVDAWEIHFFGNIATSNGAGDQDGDGVTDHDEFQNDSDPTDPNDPNSHIQIAWSTPVSVADDSDILQTGTLLHAGNFRSDNATISVTNGAEVVVFKNRQAQNAMGGLLAGEEARVIAGAGGRQVNAGLFDGSNTTVSVVFESVLDGSAWEDTDPGPAPGATDMILRLTGVDGAPLIEGQQYQIQLFYSDDRPASAGRSQVYHDNSVGYIPSAVVVAENSTCIVGTFIAGRSGHQDVHIQNTSGEANFPVGINAYVLRNTSYGSFSISMGSSLNLQWTGVSGATYGIQRRSALESGSWATIDTVPGTSGTMGYTDPSPPADKAFYRVVVQ